MIPSSSDNCRSKSRYHPERSGYCQNIFQHGNVNIPRAGGANQTHASPMTEKTAGDSAASPANPPIRLPLPPAAATHTPVKPPVTIRAISPGGAVRLGSRAACRQPARRWRDAQNPPPKQTNRGRPADKGFSANPGESPRPLMRAP